MRERGRPAPGTEPAVGSVEDIEVTGWTATVTLRLPSDLQLPDNATAEFKQTSPLGEKYVALAAPTDEAPSGRLGEGDRIPLARSSRNPEVEEVLGAMSLLLNGGASPFKEEFTKVAAKDIKPMAVENGATVLAKVYGAGVMDTTGTGGAGTTVRVLAFVNQATTTKAQTTPAIDQNRVIATMTKVGDRWLISRLEAF